jgi:hypothetical protein
LPLAASIFSFFLCIVAHLEWPDIVSLRLFMCHSQLNIV